MGWGNCGEDTEGRPIGYVFEAKCDHPGCDKDIDRGLSYACGGMHGKYAHGADVEVCEKYFCGDHLHSISVPDGTGESACIAVCSDCRDNLNEMKAEAYRDLLAEMTEPVLHKADFTNVADPPAVPTQQDHRCKRIYDVLLEWDEFDGVILDGRYMSQKEFDRRRAWRDDMARVRGAVIMGVSPPA